MAAYPWDGGEAGKFGVGLVEDDHRVASGAKNFAERGRFDQRTGRIVWIREEEDTRIPAERGEDIVERKALLRVIAARFDACAGNFGVVTVHGECGFADKDVRTRLDEGVKENAQSVVPAVGQQELLGANAEIEGNAGGGFLVFGIR